MISRKIFGGLKNSVYLCSRLVTRGTAPTMELYCEIKLLKN